MRENVQGHFNLYTDIKSCVKNGDLQSNCFPFEIGVRQGENVISLSICLVSKRFRGILEWEFY
jgi:hypothetical protein